MAAVFEDVIFGSASENGKLLTVEDKINAPVRVELTRIGEKNILSVKTGGPFPGPSLPLDAETEYAKVGKQCFLISREDKSFFLKFPNESAYRSFRTKLRQLTTPGKKSMFTLRTDEASAVQYFQFYGYLSQQQNMMQDYIRTSTYQKAMIDNLGDFEDKIVLDVGAGSGILSFFAVQAGARKVYAVEASSMAIQCNMLVRENGLQDRIVVIPGKVEEVELPEQVDVIISEPMGYMLFNERMLETYLHAKKWLKPGGNMFPTRGDLYVAPFTDEALYMEQFSKSNFWYQHAFYGVNLSCLRNAAMEEYFKQPVVDTFDVRICLSKPVKHSVDFLSADESDLHNINIPLEFITQQSGTIHGLAFWFDVAFMGKTKNVWLSTAPTEPLTHWYQVRCLLHRPLFVQCGQKVTGKVLLKANDRQSYDVDVEVIVAGNRSVNTLDLKNPFFRYTGQPPQPPPGNQNQSPTDAYWSNADPNTQNAVYVNGGMVNGQVILDAGQTIPPQTNVLATPVNQGSIPSVISLVSGAQQQQQQQPTVVAVSVAASAVQTRTSIGAGISPSAFSQPGQSAIFGSSNYPVSPHFMIGDYALGQQPAQMATILLPDGTTATLQTEPVANLGTFNKHS